MERALRTVKTLSDISPTLNGHSRDGGDWVRLLTASQPPQSGTAIEIRSGTAGMRQAEIYGAAAPPSQNTFNGDVGVAFG